ncbi:MAG TPA: hypothetical protein VF372_00205, partial [Thermodesulfobacteriota bacterium]
MKAVRKLLREYNRLKKFARVMEGSLGPEVIGNFLEEVDEEALVKLQVSPENRKKWERAKAEEKLAIVTPYLESCL